MILQAQSQKLNNWMFPKIGVPQNWWFISWKTLLKIGWFGGAHKPLFLVQHPTRNPPRNKGLIAGLIKGNQWSISPDHNTHTVDGWNPAPVEVGGLSHYLQGFIHLRWCRISAINSMKPQTLVFSSRSRSMGCFSFSGVGLFRWGSVPSGVEFDCLGMQRCKIFGIIKL